VAAPPAHSPTDTRSAAVPVAHASVAASQTVASASSTAPAAATSAPGPAQPVRWSDLNPSLRSQIPPLAITGSVYAQNPAQRMLVVNNQVFNQGAQVAPDLTLEVIRPGSAVFNFRGTRFERPY
jgi:general secretion pathway protein B